MNDSGEAGWYPDPHHRFELRYYNGQRWTNDVSTHGQRLIDSGEQMTPPPEHPMWHNGSFETPGRGMAVASFVLAISAALIGWVPYVFVLAVAAVLLAVVFGIIGLRRSRERNGAGRGFATAGLILSGVALCSCVGGLFFTTWLQHQIDRYDDPGRNTVQGGRCVVGGDAVTFSGTITNLESDTRSYELTLRFVLDGTNTQVQLLEVRDVAGGASAPWTTTEPTMATGASCDVAAVHGPAPLGIRNG